MRKFKCGGKPSTIERVAGYSKLDISGNRGDFAFENTEWDYDDSITTTDIHGNVVLHCEVCGAEWAHSNLKVEGGIGNIKEEEISL